MHIQEYMLYIVEKYIEPFFLKLDNYIDQIFDNYFTDNSITKIPKKNVNKEEDEVEDEVENGNDKKYIKDWDIIEEV